MCSLNSPSLALSRQTLRQAMTRAGWHPEAVIDAELALVELIVNAWQHGKTASPVVLLVIGGSTLRVSVADESPALPEQRTPADLAESGRGLQLVEGLTHRWGVDPQEKGKNIWFELDAVA
ncbi:ATP-binding protein [Kitasatospora sp. NPDC001159]|uniref:ATP-binding protein n=1 Tax=Kitasatospora sp. NPDC048296 TaxID=3364048 RepID=UPI00371D8CDA